MNEDWRGASEDIVRAQSSTVVLWTVELRMLCCRKVMVVGDAAFDGLDLEEPPERGAVRTDAHLHGRDSSGLLVVGVIMAEPAVVRLFTDECGVSTARRGRG
ncbi:hypothetical protein GCM10027194_35010 [Thalassiella azotivora]